MAKGALWTVLMRLSIRGIGLVSMVILARLLVPADFGLVALATILREGLLLFAEFSFDVVLIQNQQADRRHYDTVWTLSIIRNTIMTLVLVAGAAPMAAFFDEPGLEAIVYWLALATFVEGFQNVMVVDFQKHLQFHKDFAFMIGAKLGTFLVTVPLAILWRDYWALVAGILTAAFVRVVLGYVMRPYRPALSLATWRDTMDFSKWLLSFNILGFIYRRADTFTIGKFAGTQALGLYTIAFEIANMATSELVIPVRRALLPGYSKLAGDRDSLRTTFLNVFALVIMIGVPLALGIGLVADPLVRVMLGAKWVESIPIVQVLAVYGLVSVIGTGTGPVYLALRRPHILTALLGGGCALMVPLLILGIREAGAVGAAIAVTIAASAMVSADTYVITRLLKISAGRMMSAVWRTALAALAMIVVVLSLESAMPPSEAITWLTAKLLASVGAGAVTYIAVHLGLWRLSGSPDGAEMQVLTTARTVLAAKTGHAI